MTLPEWTAEMCGAVRQAGFDVDVRWGFPLVRTPPTHEGKLRLLQLQLPLACERRIYLEGMLLVPTR